MQLFRYISIPLLLMASFVHSSEDEEIKQLTRDHTHFAFSLYEAVNQTSSSNILFSPYSISTCLEMLFVGARGETADEIQRTLHLNTDRTQTPPIAHRLMKALSPQTTQGVQFSSANGIWLDDAFFVLSDYTHTLESAFNGRIARVNFENPSQAVQTINGWVKDKTQGKITDLFQPSDLTPDTRLVLTNAVYFHGNWKFPFTPTSTQQAPFYPTPEKRVTVSMMAQTAQFPYYENDLIQMVPLPFENSPYACMIILPRSSENLNRVEEELDDSFFDWIDQLSPERVALKLPKFTFSQRLSLNQTLNTLGMKLPFTTQANFSGINAKLDLYLSSVLHQAFFALNEQGVTAAAATGAAIGVKSLPPSAPAYPFTADHPFLVFILDLALKEVIFMGKFQEPIPHEVHEH